MIKINFYLPLVCLLFGLHSMCSERESSNPNFHQFLDAPTINASYKISPQCLLFMLQVCGIAHNKKAACHQEWLEIDTHSSLIFTICEKESEKFTQEVPFFMINEPRPSCQNRTILSTIITNGNLDSPNPVLRLDEHAFNGHTNIKNATHQYNAEKGQLKVEIPFRADD